MNYNHWLSATAVH